MKGLELLTFVLGLLHCCNAGSVVAKTHKPSMAPTTTPGFYFRKHQLVLIL